MARPVVISPDSFTSEQHWSRSEGFVADCVSEDLEQLYKHPNFLSAHPAHLFVPTSGSSGPKKWVALPFSGLQTACQEFNRFFTLSSSTVVLNSLPLAHIGGVMALLRAREGAYTYKNFSGSWSPTGFYDALVESGAIMTSLVPTQVHDLISLNLKSPATLKVVTGGAALAPSLQEKAEKLGWHITHSYGATETGALIAVTDTPNTTMRCLPHVTVQLGATGTLAVTGASVASAVLDVQTGKIKHFEGNWISEDRVTLIDKDSFKVLGRADEIYKNKGKKQSLQSAREAWRKIADNQLFDHSILLAFEHRREGQALGLAVTESTAQNRLDLAIGKFNELQSPEFGRIEEIVLYEALPRLENQKIARSKIQHDLAKKNDAP